MAESLTPSTPGTFGRTDNGGFDVWSWLKEHLLHGGSQPGGDPSDPSNMAAEKAKVVAEYAKRGASPNQDAAPAGMSNDALAKVASRTPTSYQHGNPGGSVTPDDAQPSMVRALWDKANTPLVPSIAKGWDYLADMVDPPPTLENSKHPQLSQLRGMLAGSLQGLAGVSANMTSPMGLASTALLGGAGFAALRNAAARQAVKTTGSINSKQAAALAEYLANKGQLPSEFSTADMVVPPSPRAAIPDPQEAAYRRIMGQR